MSDIGKATRRDTHRGGTPSSRPSVSVLLTPHSESSQVLLVRRSPRLAFLGGYWAFPGGVLEPEDKKAPILNLAADHSHLAPFLAAAAREVLEETGIWLAGEPPEAKRLRDYRSALLANELSLPEILRDADRILDARDFAPLIRLETPNFSPRRYDTWFVMAPLPSGCPFDIWPGELVEGFITGAGEALQRWRQGDLPIVPPVLFLLQELQGRNCRTLAPRTRSLAESYRSGRMHRIACSPGILVLPVATHTLAPATHTNTYIVGEKTLYLVDPAPQEPREREKIWGQLDELLAEGRALTGILLTHHHPDHIGALEETVRRYRVPVLAHELTLEQLGRSGEALRHGQQLELETAPDGSPDWKLTVYHVPGHTAGHLAFQENRYSGLLAGDMVSTISSIVIDPDEGHLATYLQSLQFLAPLARGFLYPGHGTPVRSARQSIRNALQHRQWRKERLLSALRLHPLSFQTLIERVYSDLDRRLWPLAERSLRSGLIQLQEEGCARETATGQWRLTD